MENVTLSLKHPSFSSMQEITNAAFDFRSNVRTKGLTFDSSALKFRQAAHLNKSQDLNPKESPILLSAQKTSAETSLCSSCEFLIF